MQYTNDLTEFETIFPFSLKKKIVSEDRFKMRV